MTQFMSTHCLLICGILSLVVCYGASTTLELEHAVDTSVYTSRGTISGIQTNQETTSKPMKFVHHMDETFKDTLQQSAQKGGFYRVRGRLIHNDGSKSIWYYTTIRSCSILENDFHHSIEAQIGQAQQAQDVTINSLNLLVAKDASMCTDSSKKPTSNEMHGTFQPFWSIVEPGLPAVPRGNAIPYPGQPPVIVDDKGKSVPNTKDVKPEQEPGFFQKYMHFIAIGFLVWSCMSRMSAPEENSNGSGSRAQ